MLSIIINNVKCDNVLMRHLLELHDDKNIVRTMRLGLRLHEKSSAFFAVHDTQHEWECNSHNTFDRWTCWDYYAGRILRRKIHDWNADMSMYVNIATSCPEVSPLTVDVPATLAFIAQFPNWQSLFHNKCRKHQQRVPGESERIYGPVTESRHSRPGNVVFYNGYCFLYVLRHSEVHFHLTSSCSKWNYRWVENASYILSSVLRKLNMSLEQIVEMKVIAKVHASRRHVSALCHAAIGTLKSDV